MLKNAHALAEYRARALLIVHLTRRDDIVIDEFTHDYGVDMLARMLKDGQITQRMFGIQLKATVKLVDDVQTSLKRFVENVEWLADAPFPVCLFVFIMENDQGFYTWLVEPIVSDEQKPTLRVHTSHDFIELTPQTLDMLIARVDHWYTARRLG